jgi:peptidoglycan/LPS O-acetylase OafA/YrhL
VLFDPIIGHLWSISIEEQFYLSWPLLVRRLSRRNIAFTAIVLWTISICCRWLLLVGGRHGPSIWYNTFTRLDPLACGILLCVWLAGSKNTRLENFRLYLAVSGIILLISAGYVSPFTNETGIYSVMLAYPAAAIGCTALIVSTMGVRWITHPWLVYLGRISYGLYTFHIILITLSRGIYHSLFGFSHPNLGWIAFVLTSLLADIVLSATAYRYLETPFLRMKSRLQSLT